MLNDKELIKALYEDINHADDYNSMLESEIKVLKLERIFLILIVIILNVFLIV